MHLLTSFSFLKSYSKCAVYTSLIFLGLDSADGIVPTKASANDEMIMSLCIVRGGTALDIAMMWPDGITAM